MIRSDQVLACEATTERADGSMRSLLLVEDEATLRSALARFFVRRGWQVTEAEDGEVARGLLLDGDGASQFDVVLTDMRMPRMCGMELHRIVAAANESLATRFVFSTGDTGDQQAVEFIARAHCPIIQKPFDLSTLLAMVERVAADALPDAR